MIKPTSPISSCPTKEVDKSSIMREMHWENDNLLRVDDVTFLVEYGQNLYATSSLEENKFVLGKARPQLEILERLAYDKPVRRICDLGIYKGGSVVFYHKVFDPEKIIAFELKKEPVEQLDAYIRKNGLEQAIRVFYGVDQSDPEAVQRILQTEMSGQHFDMVVDDASHLLNQTRASFNMIFPYLAPGGYYIIEDWGWAHWNNEEWQKDGGVWPNEPPLSNLIFELTMLLASRADLIESIFLLPAYAVIKKGKWPRSCEPGSFDLSSTYKNRGKKVKLLD